MGKGKKLVVSVNWDNYDEIYEQLKKNPNIKEVMEKKIEFISVVECLKH